VLVDLLHLNLHVTEVLGKNTAGTSDGNDTAGNLNLDYNEVEIAIIRYPYDTLRNLRDVSHHSLPFTPSESDPSSCLL
jgi:hypothetical protein